MDNFKLSIEANPDKADLETFWNILRQFNASEVGSDNYQKLCIFARDNNGKIIGGLDGETFYGWLFVKNIAVDEAFRKCNIGSQLLQAAETEALKRGCSQAYLDTYSFQAQQFYEKNGYTIFGTLNDFPKGHKRIFLWKSLKDIN
jgi:GNAT superfamily N-acetyltransferase